MRVAINGAGIAGPTLAFWLGRSGHDVLLLEEAAELRTGGYIVDFWGLGYDIAEKMGIIGAVCDRGYRVKEVRLVNSDGKATGGFDVDVFWRLTNDRFTSIRRSDLSAIIYGSLGESVTTVFNDSIEGIENTGDAVRVSFRNASAAEFDLVVGADGLHSRVREIVFGPEDRFAAPLGYHVAAFEATGYHPRDELVYVSHSAPGRQVSRFAMRDDKTMFLFVFEDKFLSTQRRLTREEQRSELSRIFSDVGWECPQILELMNSVDDLYFDTVSQIRMDGWTLGRTALVGDAGACVSLMAGEGIGLAMAEAYVLAGELSRSNGELESAFAAYERLLMPFLKKKQIAAERFASAFAPKTKLGIIFRDLVTRLFRVHAIADYVIGRELRDDIALPEYWH